MQPPKRTKPADRPSVLAVHHSAGVQKKTSHRKSHMSAKAKKRREKGMEMAEAVLERTSNKVRKSLTRQKAVDNRRQAWDAINRDVNEDEDDEEDDEDEDMGEDAAAAKDKKNKKQKKAAAKDKADDGWETDENADVSAEAAAAAPVDDDLDEIL